MKLTLIALALLCLALLTAIAAVHSRAPRMGSVQVASGQPQIVETNEPIAEPPPESTRPTGPAFHWSLLESEDYVQYIKRLAASGCPKHVISDIIISEFNSLFADRETPLRLQIAGFKPRTPAGQNLDQELSKQEFALRKQLRAVEEEKQAQIKALLGVEIPLEPIRGWHPRTYDRYESALNTVPSNKREQVRQIQESYWETSDLLNDKYQLRRTPEYLEEYRKINEQRKAQLASVLSPQEAADYETRFSGIASRLGNQLSGLNVSADEFRSIFELINSVEAPYGGTVRVNETESGQTPEYFQTKKRNEEHVAAILGPERYEQYQLAQQPDFQRFADLGERFHISRDNIVQAFRLQQAQPRGAPRQNLDEMRALLGESAFNAWQNGQNFSSIDGLLFP
ncbi:MAG TPA: hypothetical protein VM680_09225 [Verrucomicrobiae bacterium]|nr:hypothetical protein [Verrucomicrobiae bacterium]